MKQLGFTFMLFVIVLSPLAAVCQGLPDEPRPAVQAPVSQSIQQSTTAPVPTAPAPTAPAPTAPATAAAATAVPVPPPQSSSSAQQGPEAPSPQAPSAAQPAPPDGRWRKIQRLPHGEPIVVDSTLGPALACRFAGATDGALFCDAPGAPDGNGYRFERATVISVEAQWPEHNYHPFLLASAVGIGIAVGIRTASNAGAGAGAGAGALSALMVGAMGMAVANQDPQLAGMTVMYRPHAFRIRRGLPLMLPARR